MLLYHLRALGDAVECLIFDYGSKHAQAEQKAAQAICKLNDIPCKIIALPFVDQLFSSNLLRSGGDIPLGHYEDSSMQQTIVPGRNTIMLSIAIGYAESCKAQRVAIANHAGDHAIYPDCRPEWISSMSLVAYHGTYQRIGLFAPFTHFSKGDICSLGAKLEVPFDKTWTCYQGQELHCGRCGSCTERREAFAVAKLLDPTKYLDAA